MTIEAPGENPTPPENKAQGERMPGESTERPALTPESAPEKKSQAPVIRDGSGRFVRGASGNPAGRPATDTAFKLLAVADRQKNFDFIRRLRDNSKVSADLRFEAAKLLAQYSDGKPLGSGAPLVAIDLRNNASAVPGGHLSPTDAYRMMIDGTLPLDPEHEAFRPRHTIEAEAVAPSPTAPPVASLESSTAPAASAVEEDSRVGPLDSVAAAGLPTEPAAPAPAPAPAAPMPPAVLKVFGTLDHDGADRAVIRRRAEAIVRATFRQSAAIEREMGRPARADQLLAELAAMGLG